MTVVGFAWFMASLSDSGAALPHTVGLFVGLVWGGFFVHMLLAFPGGRLESRRERAIVAAGYLATTLLQALPLLLAEGSRACDGCPRNLALIEPNAGLAGVLFLVHRLVIVVVGLSVCVMLLTRWRKATPAQQRSLAPVLWAGGVTGGLVALSAAAESAGMYRLSDAFDWAYLAAFACVPFAFLSGLMRSRLHRADAVSELVERLGEAPRPGKLHEALADALGDPSLTLAYWLPDQERFVDALGGAVHLPAAGSERMATEIEHDGRRVAAIVHDAALCEEPELVRAAGAAASLSLENERLDAELRARLEELRASRARLVEAGDAERRRIERDLHDGVQQRLVSLLLNLKLARRRAAGERAGDEEANEALWDDVEGELTTTLAELRTLVSGILPPVLADRGLGVAVEEITSRSPIPVEIAQMPAERLPERVEVAAYFVVCEALTNVAKHARATRTSVRVVRDDGQALIEVSDDGVGGVQLGDGSGLRGLADRVGALEGRLELDSIAGRGTTIRAEIPCA
jgi:signal transduction histidine kinase